MATVKICLILVHGVVDDPVWSGQAEEQNPLQCDQPFSFLTNKFPGPQLKIASFPALHSSSDDLPSDAILAPSMKIRAFDLLTFIGTHVGKESRANTRVVLAGHDLGGLILKKALTLANLKEKREHFSWILESISAVLFYETPHNQPDVISWGKAICLMMGSTTQKLDLLSFIRHIPKDVADSEDESQKLLKGWYTMNFYFEGSPFGKKYTMDGDYMNDVKWNKRHMWSIKEDDLRGGEGNPLIGCISKLVRMVLEGATAAEILDDKSRKLEE